MAIYHTVVQGEHLTQIAAKYGFRDYRTIWRHGQNAALNAQRKNPNVLHPGDRLFIPDRQLREELRVTDRRHRFQVTVPSLKLRLVLEDQYERTIANAPCDLHVGTEVHKLTTDAQGKVEQEIPSSATDGRLIITTPETALDTLVIPIKIGHLDPVEELTGQQARLKNLGYYTGPVDGKDHLEMKLAAEEFQCEHNLAVDGVCGPQTQAKLKSVHGC